jgi:hypothetical protein
MHPVSVNDSLVTAPSAALHSYKTGGGVKAIAIGIRYVQPYAHLWASRLCATTRNLLLLLFAQFFEPF